MGIISLFTRNGEGGTAARKFLVAGLGNVGDEYAGTRHNVGFAVVDALAGDVPFEDRRYGFVARVRVRSAVLVLLKPSTYVNLSGNAVRYWLERENVGIGNLMVVADDLSLPIGTIRMKPGGSSAGHNGLKHIAQTLGTEGFARLRIGIGDNYPHGGQVDFVLGCFEPEEQEVIGRKILVAGDAVRAFALSGIQFAMNHYNGK